MNKVEIVIPFSILEKALKSGFSSDKSKTIDLFIQEQLKELIQKFKKEYDRLDKEILKNNDLIYKDVTMMQGIKNQLKERLKDTFTSENKKYMKNLRKQILLEKSESLAKELSSIGTRLIQLENCNFNSLKK